MKLRNLLGRDSLSAAYAATVTTLKRTSWRRPISAEQAESTKAILEGRLDKDRPMPENWKANPNALTMEEVVGTRKDFIGKTAEEISAMPDVFSHRFAAHRTDRNNIGQPDLNIPIDGERRATAVNAFMRAYGTGKTYANLRPEERRRVRNYFLDFLTDKLTEREGTALINDDAAVIDEMVAAEMEKLK